jgi:diacylglycerol O-acyltransferase / trehalose O-mycolyltransferase
MPFMIRLAAMVALLLTLLAAPGRASAEPLFTSGDGLTLVSASADGERTWRLVVSTGELTRPVRINVLLPRGYAGTDRRYPVLYLFHGTSGGANDWLDAGDAAAASAPYPLIVVMPDAGYDGNGGGWFTDWVDQHTPLGTANWEAYHVGQLVRWIDDNLRTVAARDGRAIAGLSQGGFGSFSYAARHPDAFVSAASFSGAPDIESNPLAKSAAVAVIGATATGLDGVEPNAMFGDPVLRDLNWQGHNPANLVTNLADTDLGLWTGDGLPGPLDRPGVEIVPDALVESLTHASTLFFAQAADAAHVAYRLDDYGPGTHSWPYWSRDLTQYLPHLMAVFDDAPPAPTSISYRSIDRTWTQWGWTVANARLAPQAWSGLAHASADGLTLTDRDPATVTTPAFYRPGSTHRLAVTGGTGPAAVTADSGGRLSMTLTPDAGSVHVAIS